MKGVKKLLAEIKQKKVEDLSNRMLRLEPDKLEKLDIFIAAAEMIEAERMRSQLDQKNAKAI